jgi:four helix bundle protein
MNEYRKLKIWEKGIILVEHVYFLVKQLPEDEKYGLVSQIKRCCISIPSNIAEGAGRNSNKEFIRFLSIVNGSTKELETQLLLIQRINLAPKSETNNILILCQDIKNMNFALQNSLK